MKEEQAENLEKSRRINQFMLIMSQYCFKCTVKSSGHFLPKGYTFQVIHSQKSLDNAAVNRQAHEEYKKLHGGKDYQASLYLSDVIVEAM